MFPFLSFFLFHFLMKQSKLSSGSKQHVVSDPSSSLSIYVSENCQKSSSMNYDSHSMTHTEKKEESQVVRTCRIFGAL